MQAGDALGLPVVIAGAGPYEAELRALAATVSVPVHFTGRVSDELLYVLYQRAELFVFMAIEDFGIMPVEAMAAGTPVLVNTVGGAAESVALVNGGATISDSAGLAEIRDAAVQAMSIDKTLTRQRARRFDEKAFRSQIRAWLGEDR